MIRTHQLLCGRERMQYVRAVSMSVFEMQSGLYDQELTG